MRWVLICVALLLPHALQAATYHFSSTGNDTTGNGSSGNPYKTISKMESLTWNAGDSFLFKCGDTFRVGASSSAGIDTKGSGSSGSPITIGAYGTCTTTADYPVITAAELVTGWANAGTNLWSKSDTANAGPNWFFDGLRAAWIESHDGPNCPGAMTENYEICYNSARTTVYVRTTAGDPDNLNSPGVEKMRSVARGINSSHNWITVNRIHFSKLDKCISWHPASNLNIIIDDVECSHTSYSNNLGLGPSSTFGGWGIRAYDLENATGFFRLINSRINNVGRDALDIDKGLPDGEITIDNNILDIGYNHGAINMAKDTGAANHANGVVTVSNNVMSNFCGGILIGDSNDGGFSNLIVEGNTLTDPVFSSTVVTRYQLGSPGRDCTDIRNGIGSWSNQTPTSMVIRNNIVAGYSRGINIYGGVTPRHVNIYNNTLVDNLDAGLYITGTLTSRNVRNNVFSNNGSASNDYDLICAGSCPNTVVNYNYFDPNHSSSHVTSWNGTGYTLANAIATLSAWGSSNIGNNVGATPGNLFLDACPSADCTPGVGSPLIDAGVDVGISFTGVAPDIGAIETTEGTNPPAIIIDGAVIAAISPDVLTITFATDDPPMLPASGCTGITLNGTSASPSSCVRSGNLSMVITLDQDVLSSDTITLDYSQASGNITNNSAVELDNISGFAVMNKVGGDLLSIGLCTSSDTFSTDRGLDKSFDDDVTTDQGSSGCDCDSEFVVTCDFGEVVNLGIVRIYGDTLGTWHCTVYDLAYSTDDVSYPVYVTDTNCFGNRWWEQDLGGIAARYIRWTITGNTTDGRTQWRELEAYLAVQPPPPVGGAKGISVHGVLLR